MEEIEMYLDEAKDMMDKSVKHTTAEFGKIRAGKAMPSMVDGIYIDYYGVKTPLTQAASVNTADARTIVIKPFERKIIADIERAIINSDLGITPNNDGEVIRLNIPPLTEERRRDLVKQVKNEAEAGKVGIRNVRKEINEALRKLQKDGASEDDIKRAEDKIQVLTDGYIVKVDALVTVKEAELMTV